MKKARFSEIDKKGKLYVDCIECERGRNGTDQDKCSAGFAHKKGGVGGCFNGELLHILEIKK